MLRTFKGFVMLPNAFIEVFFLAFIEVFFWHLLRSFLAILAY